MRKLLISILFLGIYSCIPLSIAPKIKTEKIVKTKRFKRNLPRGYGFVFEDPKDADEFYQFMDAKYELDPTYFNSNIPIQIENEDYYLSFYERERGTKTLNLIPIAVDSKLESNGYGPILEESHVTRKGKWYIVLMVSDNELKDCLNSNYPNYGEIISYLKDLRVEYLNTQNYMETYLKRK